MRACMWRSIVCSHGSKRQAKQYAYTLDDANSCECLLRNFNESMESANGRSRKMAIAYVCSTHSVAVCVLMNWRMRMELSSSGRLLAYQTMKICIHGMASHGCITAIYCYCYCLMPGGYTKIDDHSQQLFHRYGYTNGLLCRTLEHINELPFQLPVPLQTQK